MPCAQARAAEETTLRQSGRGVPDYAAFQGPPGASSGKNDAARHAKARAVSDSNYQPDVSLQEAANLDPWKEIRACFPTFTYMVEGLGEGGYARWDPSDASSLVAPENANELYPWPAPKNTGAVRAATSTVSPQKDRLCVAVSPDGRTWLKTGLILADHAAVPCVAVEGDTLYVYCNMMIPDPNGGPDIAALVTAYTKSLVAWRYRVVTVGLAGLAAYTRPDGVVEDWFKPGTHPPAPQEPMDPSVAPCPTGGWYLFYTLAREVVGNSPASDPVGFDTFVAWGATLSGFTFNLTNNNSRVYPTDADEDVDYPGLNGSLDPMGVTSKDPSVLWIGASLQYFANPGSRGFDYNHDVDLTEMGNVFTSSADRQWSDLWTDASAPLPKPTPTSMTNGALIGSDYVWYAMRQAQNGAGWILSYTYDGAGAWVADKAGAPLFVADRDYESRYVIDAAVTQFGDCYVMVYTTAIPDMRMV